MIYGNWIILAIWLLLYIHTEVNVNCEEADQTVNTTAIPDEDDDWDEDDTSEIDDDGRIYKNPRNSPSTLCPRDEEQATLLGQKCLRKCSSDEDCKSKKKKCLCDGACGMSCIKPDRECPEPEQIPFGSVTSSGRLFGSRITYTCQHGYHVVGLQSRTCQADGHWAGAPPACKQNIYCLSPPTIDHARHNALLEQTTFDLDSTLQYYCHTGYVTNGFPRAKCLAIDGQASWYGPDISCEPRSCGPPIDIANGWHAGECYTYGCRINYNCADSFELVGRNEHFCQADGSWAPKELPTCVLVTAVQCPTPENPRHGKAIYTSCSYNSIVSYECKYGYTLIGETTRRCGADKKWTGSQAVCKEINCGHPGRLWNGWLENIEGGTGLGVSIIFRCHEGMRLEGNASTVCQVDGKWRYPIPKCLAPCVVPQVSQGKVSLIYKNDTAPSSTVVQDGEALTVDCEQHYEFFLNHSPVVCNNGTWTHIPKCQPARCKHLPKPPKNGMIIAPKMEHGMRARFKCKDGFELKGNTLIECSFGNWTGEFPFCQEVFCPFPGLVINGKILLVGNMGLYDYRPYVKKVSNNKQIMYDCDKGYVLSEGPPGATCVGGNWSPRELPKCTLGQHPRLRWSRKKRFAAIKRYKKQLLKYRQNNQTQILDNDEHTKYSKHKLVKRIRRALKTGSSSSSSRVLGTGLKTSKSQPSSRRGKDKHTLEVTNFDRKKYCVSLEGEPFTAVTVIKPGHDATVPYSSGTIIQVSCDDGFGVNLPNKNATIKCARGRWRPVYPKCLSETDVELALIRYERKHNASCLFKKQDANLMIFSNDQEVGDDIEEFSNGTQLVSRCSDIGKFSFTGLNKLSCKNGAWDHPFPICTGLNQENDYSMQKPPTILFRHELGPIAQSNEGKLIVYPGATLHMECLWMRRFGVPKWTVNHEHRPYPQNWSSDPGRDAQLEYRISVVQATAEDSGLYTCLIPTRYTHAIDVDVRAVHCPELPKHADLVYSSQETKMNTQINFKCGNGNTLVGASEIICLPSGNWSSPLPVCESVACGDVGELPPHLNATILSRAIDGRTVYNCSIGYTLDGPKESTCQSSGQWSTPIPTCKEVQCNAPEIPEHGYLQGTGPYKAGDIIQYNCNSDFMMDGQPITVCQENGRWSGAIPKCVQACPYPGTIISGRMSSVRFYYKVGENITFYCEDNLFLTGASMIKCLRHGKWSNTIPTCELRSLTNTF